MAGLSRNDVDTAIQRGFSFITITDIDTFYSDGIRALKSTLSVLDTRFIRVFCKLNSPLQV